MVSPVTTHVVAPTTTHVLASGDEVTVYLVIAEPPSDAGALQVSVAVAFPALVEVIVGGPAVADGVPTTDEETGPEPTPFIATAAKV